MKIELNEERLKYLIAYLGAEDLRYTLQRSADFLKTHNKNLTKAQENAIDIMHSFITCLEWSSDNNERNE